MTLSLLALGACALILALAAGAVLAEWPRRSFTLILLAVSSIASSSQAASPPIEGPAPALSGATGWLNSPPIDLGAQRGRVVVVSFWTYSCINCLRVLPYVRAWSQRYAKQGLVVVGVHSPEFAFEKDPANVSRAVKDLKLNYPIALDDGFKVWRAYGNRFWPALYIVDAQGRIRHHQFGEEGSAETEQVIQSLLREAMPSAPTSASTAIAAAPAKAAKPAAGGKGGLVAAAPADATPMPVETDLSGVGMPADLDHLQSPESYIGYAQATAMAAPGALARDRAKRYVMSRLDANEWSLSGNWIVGPEYATVDEVNGAIGVRFHARDMNLVMGPPPDGGPVKILVTIDGQPPGEDHGVDIDAQGNGVVDATRLYQLVRQRAVQRDRRVEIRFLGGGARAYAFTFG
ncbi:MAG: thioredoxin family protein [Mitsuaria chitosanitabida]|uniref:thioredoxin family protein n=1 Tax=Roseateles chitosanitabidus TaxID=65048 RepID=UPI001B28B349|nr:thioredoxin family protein [Roseateles chitosanitabidus]MBO9687123.1 thioredoxin family protein [Roseateles chitosanitabidus]